MPKARVVFARSKKGARKTLTRGPVIADPDDIDAKIRRFRKECAAHPIIAEKLWGARRYTRWLVSVAGPRTYVAPVRYALFTDTTMQVLQHATAGDLAAEGIQELRRIEEIFDGLIYDRAVAAVQKLTGRTDDLTIFRPLQRCLYSHDEPDQANEFKKWSERGFISPAKRLDSRDAVVRYEEYKRTAPGAIAVMRALIAQHDSTASSNGQFLRGDHLRLVYETREGVIYVFMPHELLLNNLHCVVRDVLSEALEYRFRYKPKRLTFIALLSDAIAECNSWVIDMLNEYNILVAVKPQEDENVTLVGKCPKQARHDLQWMF